MSKPTYKLKTSKSKTTLIVEGALGVQHAHLLKETVVSAIDTDRDMHLSLEGVTSLDVASTQILFAFKKGVQNAGFNVTVALPGNQEVLDLLNKTGITKLL